MLVQKNTHLPVVVASDVAPTDPMDSLLHRIEDCRERFRDDPLKTPATMFAFEQELKALLDDMARQIVEQDLNRLEPDSKKEMPGQVRYRKETYRINKKTPATISTLFGPIVLRSFYYLNRDDGEPGLHPLHVKLGIGPGKTTPALAAHVARLAVDHTQTEVRAWLLKEHHLKWTNSRLRAVLADVRQHLLPYVHEGQKAKVLAWLEQAESSRGRHRPVLAAGRDGIMVPMRHGKYQEASTATVSVYDRRGRRLGTVYLGQMPESKQTNLSRQLTALLKGVLGDYAGPQPRLAYITDKGSAPEEYYRRTLKKMRDPKDPRKTLPWEWVLDFYHVCGYISKIADALFGAETKGSRDWFVKMRHWLRHRRQGAANVERSASQHLAKRTLTKAQKAEFWKAYGYLRRNNRHMDYQGYRRKGLPIGSGVTEAACKTVFTQRFKRSGMRWKAATGQVILDLRTIHLSGIWETTLARDLASREIPESLHSVWVGDKSRSCKDLREQCDQMAA